MYQRRRAILETPNRRRRKRRRAIRIGILLFVFMLLCAGAVIGIFHIPMLQIRDVEISGTKQVSPEILRQEAEDQMQGNFYTIFPKRFVLLYPREEIKAHILAKHNEIEKAEVKLVGINRIEVKIVERSSEALYCNSVSCFYLDRNGMVYDPASSMEGLTIFREQRADHQEASPIGTFPLSTEIFKESKEFASKLSSLHLRFIEVVITEDELRIKTQEGRLLLSASESFDDQFDFLKTALDQPVFHQKDGAVRNFNYIDLRFGKKIFYKLEESAVEASSTDPIVQ